MSESDSDPSSGDSYFKLSKEELDKRRKALRQLVENELARRYALPHTATTCRRSTQGTQHAHDAQTYKNNDAGACIKISKIIVYVCAASTF